MACCNGCCLDRPYVQCTMLCPPPCLVPTKPEPVKPLQLPKCGKPQMTEDEAMFIRYSNFYNNYNVDYRLPADDGSCKPQCPPKVDPCMAKGQIFDGQSPYCEDYSQKRQPPPCSAGCPTGFKPCTMKLQPPPGCDPAGIWHATIMPCPPKLKKNVSQFYEPGPCTRPCCKHWTPKDPPCNYDGPCRAACFDHPPGIKPSGKNPYLKAKC